MLATPARALFNVLRAPFYPFHLAQAQRWRRPFWVMVRLRPWVTELESPLSVVSRLVPELATRQPTALARLRQLADAVRDDPTVAGVVLELPPLQTGWARARGIRDVIASIRAAGKEVVVYLPRGGANLELYVATAASKIVLGPEAGFAALGLAIERRYIKPLLDRVGIRVESFARKEFKTAAEGAVLEAMSDAQREQLDALLQTLHDELVAALGARPDMTADRVAALFARGFARGKAAIEAGVCDAVAYEDQLGEIVAQLYPDTVAPRPRRSRSDRSERVVPIQVALVGARPYLAVRAGGFFLPVRERPYVGVVTIHGAIRDNDEEPRGLQHTLSALRAARADERCVGVVLAINSPGGSALASDRIHREVVRLGEEKPVVAYFEDVAASGGYYVAAATHAIVAQPVTITGSIGVVSARLTARELLERLGVRTEVLRRAPHADMFSPARELDEEERAILDREVDDFYESFVRLVAEGRRRPVEEIEPLARGRVWSGRDAAAKGLVDRVGGFEVAMDEVLGRLAADVRERTRAQPVSITPRGHVPPAPPGPVKSEAAGRGALARQAVLEALLPEWAELLSLAQSGERVLFFAPHLPEVR